MKNTRELRQSLSEVFTALREGDIDAKTADVLNNTAGKMMLSSKLELEYQTKVYAKEDISIPFLDAGKADE